MSCPCRYHVNVKKKNTEETTQICVHKNLGAIHVYAHFYSVLFFSSVCVCKS